MKRILSAIARMLRSSCSFVWDKCSRTGAWTLRAVASLGGGSAPAVVEEPMADFEAAMAGDEEIKRLLEPVETGLPPKAGGDGYDRIQRACLSMMNGKQPDAQDLAELSPLQREWLSILDPQMMLIVGNVPKKALAEHMRGGKGLKGVVRSDAEGVKTWRHACEIERTTAELDEPGAENEARLAI